MKECIEYESLIPEYLDGELDPSLCREFESHIEECPSCKKALEEMRALLSDISESAYPVPAELKAGVMSRIAAERSLKKKKNLIRILGGVAACFVIAVGVMSVWPYLNGNLIAFNKSESDVMCEAPEASVENELTSDGSDLTDKKDEVIEAPDGFAPEDFYSKGDSLWSEEENSVGALPDNEAVFDESITDSEEKGDQKLNSGSSVFQDGDPAEKPADDAEEDISESMGDVTDLDGTVTTYSSSYEEVTLDYGALFMCRGAANLAEILEDEE